MADPDGSPDETLDAVSGGALVLAQRRAGYRFNQDSVLLARFACAAAIPDDGRAVDLGTGSGIVALLLARWCPSWRVTGVEVQPGFVARARSNAERNGLPVDVVEADYRLPVPALPAGGFHLVVSNPPFHAAETGRTSPDPEKAIARQEVLGSVEEVVKASKRLLRSDGRLCVVYPAPALGRVAVALSAAGFVPTRWRFVHGHQGAAASVVLVEAQPGGRRVAVVEPPLLLLGADGAESDEARRWLRSPQAA